MAALYILDANILVHLVHADAVGERIRATYSPTMIEPRPLSCTVTEGELYSLAFQFRWGAGKVSIAIARPAEMSEGKRDIREHRAMVSWLVQGVQAGTPRHRNVGTIPASGLYRSVR
jgi:hypothetical protein